jgi:hypothetical protein
MVPSAMGPYLSQACTAELVSCAPTLPTQVFNSLNVIELKSLEEPRYLMNQVHRKGRAGGEGEPQAAGMRRRADQSRGHWH